MNFSTSQKAIQRRIFQHIIKKHHTFFAVVQPGFEETAKKELELSGIQGCTVTKGGVTFRGTLEHCYTANYYSRVATRILMRLCHFRAYHFNEIYRTLKEFPWELYIQGYTIDVDVSVHKSKLHHTERIGQEVVKAIEKRLSMFAIPNYDSLVQKVFVRFDRDECMISLDSSGQPLYKRGYKQHISDAPLRETLAAALLYECNVYDYDIIIDPMCGSGTFPIEAWCMLHAIPPGANRTFAFMNWPSFRKRVFTGIMRKKPEEHKDITIIAGDSNPDMVAITQQNSIKAGAQIHTYTGDFLKEKKVVEGGKVLCTINPPYGKRIHTDDTIQLYKRLGSIFKEWYPAWSFCVLIPSEIKHICTIPADKEIHFSHGGLPVTALIANRGR
ncbi:MAG: THUMP domain-containing protein [Spirochaetota bacterium]|nr:THUMP domain-containing protein [Spirochaetota bacterium]